MGIPERDNKMDECLQGGGDNSASKQTGSEWLGGNMERKQQAGIFVKLKVIRSRQGKPSRETTLQSWALRSERLNGDTYHVEKPGAGD